MNCVSTYLTRLIGFPDHTISILFEELKEVYGLRYVLFPTSVRDSVQGGPRSTASNLDSRMPVLFDHDNGGMASVGEQAIVQYLANAYDSGSLERINVVLVQLTDTASRKFTFLYRRSGEIVLRALDLVWAVST